MVSQRTASVCVYGVLLSKGYQGKGNGWYLMMMHLDIARLNQSIEEWEMYPTKVLSKTIGRLWSTLEVINGRMCIMTNFLNCL